MALGVAHIGLEGVTVVTSLTIENYVKTIYLASDAGDGQTATSGTSASTGALATALGVSPGTVTSMLKTLDESGLAVYTPYEGVRLTEAGRRLALRVLRRHRLIELFLVHTLDLTWDEVHDEAESMEHAVSDLLIDRIDQFLNHPASDPHGDPIPTADGRVATRDSRKLTECSSGAPFQLVRVMDQSPDFLRFLSKIGLRLGAEGRVAANHQEAGTITVRIDDRETTLAHEAARKLLVASGAV